MRLSLIVLAALLLSAPAAACAKKAKIGACPASLQPTKRVAPKLPRELHNEFDGTALVELIVDRAGRVQSSKVVSTDWRPRGRARGAPVGYEEAILSAVSRWRFPSKAQTCMIRVPIEIRHSSDRSNNSFNPMPLRGTG